MTSTKPQPAAQVIEIFGGIDQTAAVVKRHRSVVNRWLRPKERGGTNGAVPPKHWPALVGANQKITYDLLQGKAA